MELRISNLEKRMDRVEDLLTQLIGSVATVIRQQKEISEVIKSMDARLVAVEERQIAMDERLVAVEERLIAVEERQIAMDERLSTIDINQMAIAKDMHAMQEIQYKMYKSFDEKFTVQRADFTHLWAKVLENK